MYNPHNPEPLQDLKPTRHFIKHLFLASKVYVGRNTAGSLVQDHLHRMRRSIIRMSLTYSEVDALKRKLENLIDFERQFARLFRPDDNERKKLRERINQLEEELKSEREEKRRMAQENEEKISSLNESVQSIKIQLRHLSIEKARRQQRLRALESRISYK